MSSGYGATETQLRVSLRSLDKLRQQVGSSDGRTAQQVAEEEALKSELARKMASLSPFQRAEYQTAQAISELRQTMRRHQEMEAGGKASHGEISRCRQHMRRLEASITKASREAAKCARQEKRDSEARELLRHVEVARKYYRQRFSLLASGEGSQSDADSAITPVNSSPVLGRESQPLLSSETNFNALEFGTSLRADEEFQLFFAKIQQQDHLVDQQLDRVHAGLQRLRDNAETISSELKTQNILIDDTTTKVDAATGKLKTLNHRLKATLIRVDSSRMCIYIFCFVVLLGVTGGVLYASGVISPSASTS